MFRLWGRGGRGRRYFYRKIGDGLGGSTGGVGEQYRQREHVHGTTDAESRRFGRGSDGVASEAADGNGQRGFSVGREVASRILCDPARSELRPSASEMI